MMKVFNLMNYSRGNNARYVQIGKLEFWFSYKTVIAYRLRGQNVRGRVNEWGTTTGRHMNDIPGNFKQDRVTGAVFKSELKKVLEDHGL
jgi:hypothetical protein